MIDTLAQAVGFPYAVLLLFGIALIVVTVIAGAIWERKNPERPMEQITPVVVIDDPFNQRHPQTGFPIQPAAFMSHWRLATQEEIGELVKRWQPGQELPQNYRADYGPGDEIRIHKLIKRVPVQIEELPVKRERGGPDNDTPGACPSRSLHRSEDPYD